MNNKKLKFGIIGTTIWGNRGAEAMLATTIGQIRKYHPEAEFAVFSYYPKRDQALCNDDTIEIYGYEPLRLALWITPMALVRVNTPAVKAIKDCNYLLDLSGISYCDGRERFLLYNIFSMLPAYFVGTPIIKLSQALGTFKSPINRFFSKLFLPKYEKIYARGAITFDNLKELGLTESKFELSTDIAFLYHEDDSLSKENTSRVKKVIELLENCGKQIVAIITSSLVDSKHPDYLEKLLALIEYLESKDYQIVLVPNATKVETNKPRNNDIYTIGRLLESLKDTESSVVAVDFDINTKGIKQVLAKAELVLTSRFHGMVAALSLTKPTLVIGWSHKYQEVLELFGLNDQHLPYTASKEEYLDSLKDLIANKDKLKLTIEAKLPEVNALAEKQFKALAASLE